MKRPNIADGFDPDAVNRAASLLAEGDVVAFPTETVYGLGADAFNAKAVAKIFELKKRPRFDPLIVHVSDKDGILSLAERIPAKARLLADHFWPGPLTLILPKNEHVPEIVTSGLPTVGIRMPNHPVALSLIERLGRPIAAPSANPFGYMSTTRATDVGALFDDRLALILDGGPSSFGIESTIVSFTDDRVLLHRHGSISVEELTEVVGAVAERRPEKGRCEAPGELPYHYAPHSPLHIVAGPEEILEDDSAFLAFTRPTGHVRSRYVRILSEQGDLREAAGNFFSYLIQLDRKGAQTIYAQRLPEKGLGKAMMERLRKAEQKQLFVKR